MVTPEHPRVDSDTAEQIRGAVVQTMADPELSLRAAKEIATEHPDQAVDAARTAFELFPDDPAKRDAFLSGTEYKLLQERQAREAANLRLAVEGPEPVVSTPQRRKWLGTRVALLAVGLFTESRKPSPGGGV